MRMKFKMLINIMIAFMYLVLLPAVSGAATGNPTMEVNSGQSITLLQGDKIVASSTSGIPIIVKNIPEQTDDSGGLSVVELYLTWDPDVIHVDSAVQPEGIDWMVYLPGDIDNTIGEVVLVGITTVNTTGDVPVVYLGITTIGEPGDSSILGIGASTVADHYGNPLPTTMVNTYVRVLGERYISVNPTGVELTLDEGSSTYQLSAVITDTDGASDDVTVEASWSSDDESVVTVQSAGDETPGLLKAVSPGITTITVEYEGVISSAIITVYPGETVPDPVTDEDTGNDSGDTAPVENEQVDDTPAVSDQQPEATQEPEPETTAETPVDDTEPEQPATTTDQPDTAEVVDPAVPDTDDDAGSGIPVGWIIGGAAVAVAVIGALGYTLFIRGRY